MSEEEIRAACLKSGHQQEGCRFGQPCVPCIEYDNRCLRARLREVEGERDAEREKHIMTQKYRDGFYARAEAAEKALAAMTARVREFDKTIDAEGRDPNGTIWEVTSAFARQRDEARAEVASWQSAFNSQTVVGARNQLDSAYRTNEMLNAENATLTAALSAKDAELGRVREAWKDVTESAFDPEFVKIFEAALGEPHAR